jgi:hypothetical protein
MYRAELMICFLLATYQVHGKAPAMPSNLVFTLRASTPDDIWFEGQFSPFEAMLTGTGLNSGTVVVCYTQQSETDNRQQLRGVFTSHKVSFRLFAHSLLVRPKEKTKLVCQLGNAENQSKLITAQKFVFELEATEFKLPDFGIENIKPRACEKGDVNHLCFTVSLIHNIPPGFSGSGFGGYESAYRPPMFHCRINEFNEPAPTYELDSQSVIEWIEPGEIQIKFPRVKEPNSVRCHTQFGADNDPSNNEVTIKLVGAQD